MKASKISLIIFFISTFFAIAGSSCGISSLLLLGKPIVVPSLIFYYVVQSKKMQPIVFLIFGLNFLGESIALFNLENEYIWMSIPFLLANCGVIYFILKSSKKIVMNLINWISIFLVFIFLIIIWIFINSLFLNKSLLFHIFIVLYGLTLLLIGLLSCYRLIISINLTSIFLLTYTFLIIISGTFYITFNHQYPIKILNDIHFICQMISHYFLILFIIHQENYLITKLTKSK